MKTQTQSRSALAAWLWGRPVRDVGTLADDLLALPIVERAALIGIELERVPETRYNPAHRLQVTTDDGRRIWVDEQQPEEYGHFFVTAWEPD